MALPFFLARSCGKLFHLEIRRLPNSLVRLLVFHGNSQGVDSRRHLHSDLATNLFAQPIGSNDLLVDRLP